jgi:flagellar motility protein MotE (MotC chaperone)
MKVNNALVSAMKSERISVLTGGALGVATTLAAILMATSLPAGAQGWTTETTQVQAKKAVPTAARKPGRVVTAKKPAKSQERLDPVPVDEPPHAYAPLEDEAPNRITVRSESPATTAATVVPKPAPAAAPAPAPAPPAPATTAVAAPVSPSAQTGPEPIPAAAETEEEPDDPFVDLHLVERSLTGDVATTQAAETSRTAVEVGPTSQTPAGQYCTNIADAAIDARIAWQRQNLAEAEKLVQQKATELEAKTAEFQRWLQRRDEFVEKAKKTVVDIYTKMKPDAAALQLQVLDEETAAAVLVKLDPRTASAVMNEMDPTQAARLTSIISGAARTPRPRAPAAAGRS